MADTTQIQGVIIKKLVKHCDDRGFLMELLREQDTFFAEIKQTTYTESYPDVIKAFHYHKQQDDLWFVAKGMAQVVMHDLRKGSATNGVTQVVYAGEDNPVLLFIPRGVAHGYRVLGNERVGILYHTTAAYDPGSPDEHRIAHDDPAIGFDWHTKNR
ncbi:spore coat protein [Candidatus Woesearchaeota archaeon CG1_02_57_44]|nr:MAG: spore coat protein [Candidatus Woesearchaeota archaeon CG1_02_57_44]PIN68041.1 MAG: spore coat protein [Candidatus Woesearchaeota archaeon CG11_big_fil_rev_8_21_14_0_20_57_5]